MLVETDSLKRQILCIEDEADLRELIVEELEEAGYQVLEAADGKEAMALMPDYHPDLILCDIAMPNMGGYEFLAYVREQQSHWMDIPFVFLTAQDSSGQIVQGKHAGADDYLVKPIHFDLMLATIEARLRQVDRFRQTMLTQVVEQAESATKRQAHFFQRMAKTFDLVSAGIVLLDRQARVQLMNVAAQKLLQSEHLASKVLLIQKQDEWRIHHAAIRQGIEAACQGQDYMEFVALPRQDGQRDMLLSIYALDQPTEDLTDPVVALFFCHNDRDEPAPVRALEALFQLTPTESQVAWAFAKGMRPDDIASHFNISLTTVAFHKRNIFQKTHTNRQVDLIALLLTLPVLHEQ